MAETHRALWRLFNEIRHYPWGSRHAIAEIQGRPTPTAEPEAELWMGGHAQGSSRVEVDGRRVSLRQLLAERPRQMLGRRGAAEGHELSFLLKVLAADAPLSVQAHPNAEQARLGFAREEAAGIDRKAGHRNYRDVHAKPEIIVALTPFSLIRGFRSPRQILEGLRRVGLDPSLPPLLALREDGPPNLHRFFADYMALDDDRVAAIEATVLDRLDEDLAEHRWVRRLAQHYPGDRGLLAPLWLHYIELAPGEAIFTPPGVLHAYLDGLGIELMGSSDNVLRGGLTPKHVDVEELLQVVDFSPQPPRTLRGLAVGEEGSAIEHVFEVPTDAFTLSRLDLDAAAFRAEVSGAEILFCLAGDAELRRGGECQTLTQGNAYFIAAEAGAYHLDGRAVVFRARGLR